MFMHRSESANYFFACNLLGLLLFLYLTVRTAQGMLVRDSVPHFVKSAGLYDLWLLMRNPGVLRIRCRICGKNRFGYDRLSRSGCFEVNYGLR